MIHKIDEDARYVVIDACNNEVLLWCVNNKVARLFAMDYARANGVTVVVVFVMNSQMCLHRYDGECTMWFWPGDETSKVAVARYIKRYRFSDIIIQSALENGHDYEWVKKYCGLLKIN